MPRLLLSFSLVVGLAMSAIPAAAQDEEFPVAVFDGRGLGHGLGLPVDGAHHLAARGRDADRVLRQFYPDARLGSGEGIVRVLLTTVDELRSGVELLLPDGGTVRDGRVTPVAPSFPVRVPSEGRVKITFDSDMYRAEVLDDRSVTGTIELGDDDAPSDLDPAEEADPAEGAEGVDVSEPNGDVDAGTGATPPFPELGASPNTLWIEPRGGGLVMLPTGDGAQRGYEGLIEVVVEAERMHVVNELDVEKYLRGLAIEGFDDEELELAAVEAWIVAARSYALRASLADPKVGRFHLYADQRSNLYVGLEDAGMDVRRAAEATEGRVLEHDGIPIAALATAAGGGSTAAPVEVFGSSASDHPYLEPRSYETAREFRWRVEMNVGDIAERLGYDGEATTLMIADSGPSGRPTLLVVDGANGAEEFGPATFHPALRLPSSAFEVTVESRVEPVPRRDDSAPFQELPDEAVTEPGGGSGLLGLGDVDRRDLPPVSVLIAFTALGLSIVALAFANVQRLVRHRRERRRSRRHHPTATSVASQSEAASLDDQESGDDAPSRPEQRSVRPADPVEVRPGIRIAGRPVEPRSTPDDPDRPERPPEQEPVSPQQRERRDEIETTQATHSPDDHDVAGRSDQPTGEERSLRQTLGWDDAPDWLDEPTEPTEPTGPDDDTRDTHEP